MDDRRTLESIDYEACIALFLGYNRRLGLTPPSLMAGGPYVSRGWGDIARRRGRPRVDPRRQRCRRRAGHGLRSRELLERSETEIADALTEDARKLGVSLPAPDWRHTVARRHATVVPRPGYFKEIVAFRRPTARTCALRRGLADWFFYRGGCRPIRSGGRGRRGYRSSHAAPLEVLMFTPAFGSKQPTPSSSTLRWPVGCSSSVATVLAASG